MLKKIKTELKKQYQTVKKDREEALSQLSSRLRKDGETLQDFAFYISELVGLAYPSFAVADREIHEKDYFIRGLHPEIQLRLRTLENFSTLSMKDLLENTIQLEIAGVKSTLVKIKTEVNEVRDGCPIAKSNIEERLEDLEGVVATLNDTKLRSRGRRNNRGGGSQSREDRSKKRDKGCWKCGNPSHFLRQCPERFCQSCGQTGHDAWSKSCNNHS